MKHPYFLPGKGKFFLVKIFLLFNFLGFSQIQHVFPDSASWRMDFETTSFGTIPPSTQHYPAWFKTNGDTVVGGVQYKVIARNFSQYNPSYFFIREQGGNTYFRYCAGADTAEYLIYSYSWMPGDTVPLPASCCMGSGNTVSFQQGLVTDTASILIGSAVHRKTTVSSWITFEFADGVGSLQGLAYFEIPVLDWWGELICFSRNDTSFATDGSGSYTTQDCWQTIGIEKIKNETAKVYPNPASSIVTIIHPGFSEAVLCDVNGKAVMKSLQPEMNIETLVDGLYFLTTISKDGYQSCVKIIKSSY